MVKRLDTLGLGEGGDGGPSQGYSRTFELSLSTIITLRYGAIVHNYLAINLGGFAAVFGLYWSFMYVVTAVAIIFR